MSYEVYICGDCGGPVYFPYGDLMHIGTGWYCWRKLHPRDGSEPEPAEAPARFIGRTGDQLRRKLVDEACRRFAAWTPLTRRSRLIPYLQRQLRTGHGDVVRDFFLRLIHEPPKKAAALVRAVMTTPEWRRYVRRAFRQRLKVGSPA